ncbi:MAG: alpha/beta hydrolase [Eubacterium sp.]|nr:alpha/beta hydrolase [Eubacterium sp.]
METIISQFGHKNVIIYPSASASAPVVYNSDFIEEGEKVLARCRRIGCPKFHLVTISNLNWDQELSPWPHEPVVSDDDHFEGQAETYMKQLEEEIIPYAENELKGRTNARIICGYSMAGLFAAYAPFISDCFDGLVCASGSVWYPDFKEFFLGHDFKKTPVAAYFSLGNKESKSRNPYLQMTEPNIKALSEECIKRGVKSIYEENPGSHFRDSDLRTAKGIAWVLRNIR